MTEKVPSLSPGRGSPGRGSLTNKWVPRPKPMLSKDIKLDRNPGGGPIENFEVTGRAVILEDIDSVETAKLAEAFSWERRFDDDSEAQVLVASTEEPDTTVLFVSSLLEILTSSQERSDFEVFPL